MRCRLGELGLTVVRSKSIRWRSQLGHRTMGGGEAKVIPSASGGGVLGSEPMVGEDQEVQVVGSN